MEGFKKLPKMQCFKEGGYVTSKPKSVVEKTTKVAPTGDKKANAKSAAVAPKEKEDKVDITTMKKGGRAKKAIGTVKKFVKAETKKASGDKDKTIKVKPTGNKKADAPSKAAIKGKEIKKFAVGGTTGDYGPEGQNTPAYPYGNGPDTPGYQLDPSGPYVKDEGFGNGPYPPGFQPPGSTPGFSPNLGPTDMPIGTPTNGGGGTLSPYPTNPMQPPVSPTAGYNPNFNPTFTNNNTFNASNAGNDGFGGANPMQNPGGQQPGFNPTYAQQSPAPAAPAGSVNLLPGLFGAK